MGDVLPFLKKPERGDEWPWPVLKEIIEGQAPESVAARMKPDVLRWVERAQEVSSGICSEGTRDQLVLLVAEVLFDRINAETRFERERARA